MTEAEVIQSRALTKEARDALPDDMFAVPETRDMPLQDERHVRMAWSMVDRTGGLSDKQRAEARRRILRRAKELGIDTKDWQIHAVGYQLSAMSLEVPSVPDHPNRMPFSGILTRIDEPSDNPPHGSLGKRVLIPKNVAEAALPSLLGMAVDFKPALDGHDNQSKIGIITEATIEGNAVHIAGFLYASDFPEECARIKAEKQELGFSYECQAAVSDLKADPWVVTHVIFTGAAVLKKTLAAYTTTSLAAQAEVIDMEPNELKKLIAESVTAAVAAAVAPISDKIATIEKNVQASAALHERVKPHAERLRSCAAAMEAAGIGMDHDRGHVKVLRHMADRMEAEAMMGHLPQIHRDHDYISGQADQGQRQQTQTQDPETKKVMEALQASLASMGTELKDLKAKAFQAAEAPGRRTISSEIKTLLDKHGLAAAAEEGKLTVALVDKALEGMDTRQRIEQKLKLMSAGVLSPRAA